MNLRKEGFSLYSIDNALPINKILITLRSIGILGIPDQGAIDEYLKNQNKIEESITFEEFNKMADFFTKSPIELKENLKEHFMNITMNKNKITKKELRNLFTNVADSVKISNDEFNMIFKDKNEDDDINIDEFVGCFV